MTYFAWQLNFPVCSSLFFLQQQGLPGFSRYASVLLQPVFFLGFLCCLVHKKEDVAKPLSIFFPYLFLFSTYLSRQGGFRLRGTFVLDAPRDSAPLPTFSL